MHNLNNVLSYPKIFAHRGLSAKAPENTLPAFEQAAASKFKWIEFDVRLTSDGHCIVFHDEELARTTNGKGRIAALSLSELKLLDAGSWFSEQYLGTKIPTLEEVLTCLNRYSLSANIEIKPTGENYLTLVETVLKRVNHQLSNKLQVVYSSFDWQVYEAIREHSRSAKLALLMDTWRDDWKEFVLHWNCDAIHIADSLVTEARVKAMQEVGCLCGVYTVNDTQRANELFKMGVDSIFSDCLVY